MKKISILVPTFNEQENVVAMVDAIEDHFKTSLAEYDYEIIFIDNDSKDNTRPLLRDICAADAKVKAIFNAKNFGQFNSPYYGLTQTTGDCAVLMSADFQDPVEMIEKFVREWEAGHKIVIGIKTSSKENKIMRKLRTIYYKLIRRMSSIEQIEHFTGFGLYDRSFIDVLATLDDSKPFLRGIVAELGYKVKKIPYEQQKRRAGKTHNNLGTLYDAAMLSFTTYTKFPIRLFTILGGVLSLLFVLAGIVLVGVKIGFWIGTGDYYGINLGTWPIVITVAAIGAINMFVVSIVGEYVLNINSKILHRPLVIEEERINFDNKTDNDGEKIDD